MQPTFSLISVDDRSDSLHLYPWREWSSLQIKKTSFLFLFYNLFHKGKVYSIQYVTALTYILIVNSQIKQTQTKIYKCFKESNIFKQERLYLTCLSSAKHNNETKPL